MNQLPGICILDKIGRESGNARVQRFRNDHIFDVGRSGPSEHAARYYPLDIATGFYSAVYIMDFRYTPRNHVCTGKLLPRPLTPFSTE